MSQNGKNTSQLVRSSQEKIDVYLAEWTALISEQQQITNKESTFLSLSVTTVGVLLGLIVTSIESELILACLNCVLVPGAVMLMGGLWMDCVFRRIYLATYVYELEHRVNDILALDGDNMLGREHYTERMNKMVPFFFRVNHLYYYFCTVFYLLFPWVTVGFHCIILQLRWYVWCMAMPVLYSLYFCVLIAYCFKISRLGHKL